jgi:RNA polymerase sigma factor for flagellar operon FliA
LGTGESPLWERWIEVQDESARHGLIEQNMPLVETVLRGIKNVRPTDREDLRGAGYVGLIRAVDEWNPLRMEWERFARFRIRAAMVDHIREMSWAKKGVLAQAARLDGAEEALAAELGRQPTPAELADRLDLSEEEALDLLSAVRGTDARLVSLDYREGSEAPWWEAVADKTAEDPGRVAARREEIDRLELILQRLDANERAVLYWRFLGWPRVSQKEIARRLGVHESRISQIIKFAVEKARALREQPGCLFPEIYAEGPRMTVRE